MLFERLLLWHHHFIAMKIIFPFFSAPLSSFFSIFPSYSKRKSFPCAAILWINFRLHIYLTLRRFSFFIYAFYAVCFIDTNCLVKTFTRKFYILIWKSFKQFYDWIRGKSFKQTHRMDYMLFANIITRIFILNIIYFCYKTKHIPSLVTIILKNTEFQRGNIFFKESHSVSMGITWTIFVLNYYLSSLITTSRNNNFYKVC